MKVPKYVLRFIAKNFDGDGWYHREGWGYKELKWLFRHGVARGQMNYGTDKRAITLLGDVLHFRIALKWRNEFGLTMMTAK